MLNSSLTQGIRVILGTVPARDQHCRRFRNLGRDLARGGTPLFTIRGPAETLQWCSPQASAGGLSPGYSRSSRSRPALYSGSRSVREGLSGVTAVLDSHEYYALLAACFS